MDGGLICTTTFGIRTAQSEMNGTTDFFIEQNVTGVTGNTAVATDTKLADAAGAFIAVQQLMQKLFTLFSCGVNHTPLFKRQPYAGDFPTHVNSRPLIINSAVGAVFNGSVKHFAVWHVKLAITYNTRSLTNAKR